MYAPLGMKHFHTLRNMGRALILPIAGLFSSVLNGQALNVTSTLSNYNGYNVSCFGKRTGAIDLTVSGGVPPYTYDWSTSASTQDVDDLAAGYYGVLVRDAGGNEFRGDFTLTQPEPLDAERNVNVYPNGYNLSCAQCFNGSITIFPSGGVGPFSYVWRDGVATQHRYNLGAVQTNVNVLDANGCEWNSEIFTLTSPERTDWTMTGNANTNPATQYIGTSDNKDVVFRANGTERFRLLANGQVKFAGLGDGMLRAGGGGIISTQAVVDNVPQPADPLPFWSTTGNYINTTNMVDAFLGTKDNTHLSIRTNATERMVVLNTGKVGIGQGIGATPLGGALTLRSGWDDWLSLRSKDGSDNDLGTWHFQNPAETDRLVIYYEPMGGGSSGNLTLWANGKMSIGDVSVNTPDYDYGLYLWKGLLTERVKVAIKTSAQWADHVFRPGYLLMPLPEVDRYIAANGHLPGVPSAECMVEEGLDVVSTDAMLLEKLEEVTLHLIRLNARIEELERTIGASTPSR
jgi:hypothetical protein